MLVGLKVITYEESRLEFFKGQLAKANKKLERHVDKMATGKLNAYDYEVQDKACELGSIVSFYSDVVAMLENDNQGVEV